jgi:hypothetical protein
MTVLFSKKQIAPCRLVTRNENISLESNVRYSDCTLFPDNTTSKLEVQLIETLNKSPVSGNSLSEGNNALRSVEHLQRERNAIRNQQASKMPACKETKYQFSTKESKLEIHGHINSNLGDNSIHEKLFFKLAENEDRFANYYSNSVENIFTSSEWAPSPQTGMSFLIKKHADQDLLSSNVPISDKNINIHTKLVKAKKATEPESGQDNSNVSELSDSNVSSVGNEKLLVGLI